jgi:hypothetical protein
VPVLVSCYEDTGGARLWVKGFTVTVAFSIGERVRVSDSFFWARGATGIIAQPPDEVVAISGPWDNGLTLKEESALGFNIVYWVWFDTPQHDADGDGPYRAGCIWQSALVRLQ